MTYKILNGSEYFPKEGIKAKKAVIMLHGVGADGENLMGLADQFTDIIADSYFVSPNAPYPYDMGVNFLGYAGYQWFSLNDRSFEKLRDGVENASKIVAEFIDEVSQEKKIDYKNIYLLGFSQGCMTAVHTALRVPKEKQLGGVLGFSGGTIVLEQGENEVTSKPPITLIHGEDDDIVPAERTELTYQFLQKIGVKSEAYFIEGLNHSIDYEGIKIARDFFLNN